MSLFRPNSDMRRVALKLVTRLARAAADLRRGADNTLPHQPERGKFGCHDRGKYVAPMCRASGAGIFAIMAEANFLAGDFDPARRCALHPSPDENQSFPFFTPSTLAVWKLLPLPSKRKPVNFWPPIAKLAAWRVKFCPRFVWSDQFKPFDLYPPTRCGISAGTSPQR